MLLTIPFLCNQGINSRFYHGFQCEDHVGRLCDALCISQKQGLEKAALEKWYVGFLGYILPCHFVLPPVDPKLSHQALLDPTKAYWSTPTWLRIGQMSDELDKDHPRAKKTQLQSRLGGAEW